ncbi:MAG: thermonuclease family protein [Sphingomonadales bacterium]|nr:thermonuclease family protein [Sphingomonadales bacterium]
MRKPMLLLFVAVLAGLGLIAAATHWRRWGDAGPVPVRLAAGTDDRESARFTLCGGRWRADCVVDGDTIHYRGEKIRVADINAPEVSEPKCDHELDLGEKASDRLLELLNQGRFSLRPLPDRDEDVYGRKLRTITRGGRSLGEVLVAEGLAERWRGYRRDWCS